MVLLDYLLYLTREYRVLTAMGLLVLWVVLTFRLKNRRAAAEKHGQAGLSSSLPARVLRRLLPGLALLVLCFGRVAGRAYVQARGVEGRGTVVSTAWGIKINQHAVRRYRTLLTLQDGSQYLTRFDEQSGAICGELPEGSAWYPELQQGEVVRVKYLPRFPANFIVLANDFSSTYGTRVICEGLRPLQYEVVKAETPYRNAPTVPEFREELVARLDALLAAAKGPCLNEQERGRYTTMRDLAKAGKPLP